MNGPTRRPDSAASIVTPPERSFLDEEGVRWHVYERSFTEYDRRSGQSLIFASDAAVRRVRAFPQNWRELSDEDLATLSWRA